MLVCVGAVAACCPPASLPASTSEDEDVSPARSRESSYTQSTFGQLGSDNETRRASSKDGTAGKRIRSQLEVGLHLGRDETRCPESLKAWKGRHGDTSKIKTGRQHGMELIKPTTPTRLPLTPVVPTGSVRGRAGGQTALQSLQHHRHRWRSRRAAERPTCNRAGQDKLR